MRLSQAPASTFTDVRSHYEKTPALIAWLHQARGAVVNSFKPTGVSVEALAPVTSPTHPGERTQSKLAFLLSPRLPGRARYGADNERYIV